MAKEERRPRHFIRQWRKFRGLTLEQLAERLHTTHATLSRIETGKMAYTQPLLERLAEELRTDPASLIVRDPSDPEGLWSIYDTLSPPERQRGAALLRVLKTGTDNH
jgi:transcriptional regulator with XRE-family HTH domain